MNERQQYIRKYQREWLTRRRQQWLVENGPCRQCGASNDLQIDHINPADKKLHARGLFSRTEKVRLDELSKCQVLCKKCHNIKTKKDLSEMQTGKPKFNCRRYTKAQYIEVFKMFDSGVGAREVAKILNIPRGTVSSWIYGGKILDWYQEYKSHVAQSAEQSPVKTEVRGSSPCV